MTKAVDEDAGRNIDASQTGGRGGPIETEHSDGSSGRKNAADGDIGNRTIVASSSNGSSVNTSKKITGEADGDENAAASGETPARDEGSKVEEDDGDKEARESDSEDEDDDDDDEELFAKPTPTSAAPGPPGLLSPNSIEIRRNAREILQRQPRNRRREKKRRSLQPLSLSSFINSCGNGTNGSNILQKPTALSDVPKAPPAAFKTQQPAPGAENPQPAKQELEVEEIKRAAGRAVEAGGEALEAFGDAFEDALEEFSRGARRARKSLSGLGKGRLWE